MASLRVSFHLLELFLTMLLLSHQVFCDNDKEDNLFKDLNKYRTSLGLPVFKKNDHAGCLADKIADQIERQPCTSTNGANAAPGSQPQFKNYTNLLTKCHIDPNAVNGTILPVCVRKLDPTTVLNNYTRSNYATYLNDSKYAEAGAGSEDDWMVVVLIANASKQASPPNMSPPNTPGGAIVGGNTNTSTTPAVTSKNAASSVFELSLGHCLAFLLASVIYLIS